MQHASSAIDGCGPVEASVASRVCNCCVCCEARVCCRVERQLAASETLGMPGSLQVHQSILLRGGGGDWSSSGGWNRNTRAQGSPRWNGNARRGLYRRDRANYDSWHETLLKFFTPVFLSGARGRAPGVVKARVIVVPGLTLSQVARSLFFCSSPTDDSVTTY